MKEISVRSAVLPLSYKEMKLVSAGRSPEECPDCDDKLACPSPGFCSGGYYGSVPVADCLSDQDCRAIYGETGGFCFCW